jgi:hypothetical protein
MSYLVREIDELQRKVRGHERVASAMARRIDELENELMDYRQTYGEIDMVLCEQLWHEHFAEKKIKGEWFRLDEKDIAFFFCAGTYDSMQHLYCIEPTHNPSGYTEQDHLDRPEDIWEGDNDACLPN